MKRPVLVLHREVIRRLDLKALEAHGRQAAPPPRSRIYSCGLCKLPTRGLVDAVQPGIA